MAIVNCDDTIEIPKFDFFLTFEWETEEITHRKQKKEFRHAKLLSISS